MKTCIRTPIAPVFAFLLLMACTPVGRNGVGGPKSGIEPTEPVTARPAPSRTSMGTDSSGGGNVSQPGPVSVDEVRAILEATKPLLPYVFNHVEWSFQDEPRIRALLFEDVGGQSPISRRIARVRYEYQDEPCRGPNGSEDAAAFPDGRICFSLPRLSASVDQQNAFVNLLALATHEVSHLAGTDENEARTIQGFIERTATDRLRSGLEHLKDTRFLFALQIGYLKDSIVSTIASLESGAADAGMTCVGLGQSSSQVTALLDSGTVARDGVALMRRKSFYYYYDALNLKLGIATYLYCTEASNANRRRILADIGPSGRSNAEDVIRRINAREGSEWINSRHRPMRDIPIGAIDTGDNEGLLRELRETLALVGRLESESKSPTP